MKGGVCVDIRSLVQQASCPVDCTAFRTVRSCNSIQLRFPNGIGKLLLLLLLLTTWYLTFIRRWYVVRSKRFRPDIQKPRHMENAVRDT